MATTNRATEEGAASGRSRMPVVGGVVTRWQNTSFLRKLTATAVVAAAVSLPLVVLASITEARLADARADQKSLQEARNALDDFRSARHQATEAAQLWGIRLFVGGTLDERFLGLYRENRAEIPDLLARLDAALPADLARQFPELESAVEAQFSDLDDLLGGEPPEPGLELTNQFRNATDAEQEVRALDSALENALDERLSAQTAQVNDLEALVNRLVVAGLAITLVAVAGGALLVTTGIVRRVEHLEANTRRFLAGEPLVAGGGTGDEIGELEGAMTLIGALLDERRQEALNATRAKDEFLSRTSHELRTPLTAVIGFGEILEDDDDVPPARREMAGQIVRSGEHLLTIIDDLLDMSKLETGHLPISISLVPVHQVADEAVTLAGGQAAAGSVALRGDYPRDLTVAADPQRLQQILLNLLTNAIKRSPSGAAIEVTAHPTNGAVRISVTDAGPTIPEKDLERIFHPFERLRTTGNSTEGSGIGLALVKHLVDAMGGTITVESRPDHGTTFHVDLPIQPPAGTEGEGETRDGALPEPDRTPAQVPPVPPPRQRAGPLKRTRMWWRNAPVRRKLIAVAVPAAAVALATAVLALLLEQRLTSAQETSNRTRDQLEALGSVLDASDDASFAATIWAIDLYQNEQAEAAFSDVAATVPDRLDRLRASLPSELDPIAQDLEAATERQFAELGALIRREPTGLEDAPPEERFLAAADAQRDVRRTAADLQDRLDDRLESDQQQVADLERLAIWALAASWVITFAAVMGGAALVVTSIVHRLRRLSDDGARWLAGMPLLPLPASQDEVGHLTDTIAAAGGRLEQRRREAVAAARAKSQFLSRTSGELRLPLGTIVQLGQSIEADPALTPDARKAAHHIVAGGDHLVTLIDDLVDMTRLEAGRVTVTIGPVAVHEVADEAVSMVDARATARPVTLRADYPRDLTVAADPQRLRQALLNLLTNAIKYNNPGGEVEITAEPRDGTVRISVADTGPGIPEEDLDRLFEPFERLQAGTTGTEGSGIGLALVKYLVEAMGGTVTVESQVDRGTTFHLDLPIHQPGGPAQPAPTTAPGEGEGETPEVLIDQPLILYTDGTTTDVDRMRALARDRRVRVEVVTVEHTIPTLVRLLQPHMVLLPADLREIDAPQAVYDLKSHPDTASVTVVILTSDPTPEQTETFLALGASAVLTRPVDTERVLTLLGTRQGSPL